MADSVDIDVSEILALSREIAGAPGRLTPETRKVVSRGAMNVKRTMQADLRASTSFRGVARAVSYDLTDHVAVQEAEIGPSSEAGSPGNLANIAYFGGARGGGTVRDPAAALEEEAPGFFEAVEALVAEAVFE
ncbi:hypothetical protein V2J56_09185 [Georgenia sp. MJ206]|uniref:hypothetical protein n=1 Tax=Georgenia wangjunii TaxID=3117730 RepID=UPI002F26BAA1